ncbi:FprA family A-type flavoprotein [Agathobaculum sp.]|uniref:FprA family A-type flavoprotein n=1 Tax=Agathobaculum sp. TaxID=2048138 RepID=UPI003AB3F386
MHSTRKVKDDLIYVGGSDRRLSRFENLFPIPKGVSYNSYVLLDEKIVLFDTADESISRQYIENVVHALNGRPLDYMVVQHMEPDHCAMIDDMLRRYPEAKMVCSAKAVGMFAQFYGTDVAARALVVKEGDKLSTGEHTLHFVMAPMVHWPEVMVTYDEKDKILFSADAFGTFGALAGNIFNDEITFDTTWMNDARRYYTNIVGKYGVQVQALLKKAASLDIEMICPLHGPIWRKDLGLLLEKYQKWSTYEPEDKTVMIAYATMYGNTENAANVLAGMLADKGVKNIAMYDVSETDVSELVAESFRCSHLVLAAPTYNSRIQPKMEAYLSDIKALNLQNRTVAVIDNGTWAATAGKQMIGTLEGMKNMTILENTISIKSALAENQLGALEALADELAKQVNG